MNKNVQRSVTKGYRTLKVYGDSLQNPRGCAALGKKIYPPDKNFGRDTALYVRHSPSCFANSLQKKTNRQERTGKNKPARARQKSTFTFPDGTSPLDDCPRHISLNPRRNVPTANTVQPSCEQPRTPAPTYPRGPRWADAEDSNGEDSILPPADEESTEADKEKKLQCWLRDTPLESQLKVGAEFHPAHPPSAPLVPEPTPNDNIAGGLVHQDVIDARFYATEANFDARLCAMEATNHSALQDMMGQLKVCLLDVQSVLISVAKDPDSLSVVTIHLAMNAMEHRLTTTINSVLLADANKPASSSVPDNTDADALRPKQGQKKKKKRKKKKKKSKISTQEIEEEPVSHPAHEAVEDATSDSTSLIVDDFKPLESLDFLSQVMTALQMPVLRKNNCNLPLIREFFHVRVSQYFGRHQKSKHRFDLLLMAQEKGRVYSLV